MRRSILCSVVVLLAVLGPLDRGDAFDGDAAFTTGGQVLSLEGGYGEQFELVDRATAITGFELFNAGVRLGFLPWGVVGAGPFKGAFEIGVEPFYQRFIEPERAYFAGLGAVARYHFLPLGPLVPYVELAAAPGATDLRVREQRTDVVFLLFAGAGASYFVTERAALYAGYRFQHISNAGTDSPNQGINSHTGVAGLSIFFR